MRLLEPPGWPWLLAHELRIGWRTTGSIRSKVMWVLFGLLVIAGHFGAYFMARRFDADKILQRMPLTVYLGLLFILTTQVSVAFGLAVRAILERGDYDLLLAAPVSAATIYAVRGIAIALGSVGVIAIVWVPLANMGPFAGHPGLLAAYPVMLSLGLACAAIALAGTLGLVRMLGLRRARTVAQVLGAVLGVSLILGMQIPQMLGRERSAELARWIDASPLGALLLPDSPLGWPLRAFGGELLPFLVVVILGVGFFALTVRLTQRAFIHAVQEAPQALTAGPKAARSRPARAFRTSGFTRLMVAKELTLIARDPALIGMTFLQALYTLPLVLVFSRGHDVALLVAPAVVLLASSLSGNLAWIAASGEEAPDLIGSAPVSASRALRLRVMAALLPVAVIVAPFVAWYALGSIGVALTVAVFAAVASVASGLVQVVLANPGGGRDLKRRKQDIGVNLLEFAGAACWSAACWFTLGGSPWALLAIAAGCAIPAASVYTGRLRRREA